MYVKILYGENETLVCNPSCAIVNLLASIRRRAGIKNHKAKLDLSDETGLVKELNGHNNEIAEKFLVADGTYVLLQKVEPHQDEIIEGYTPLLDNCTKYLPGYQVHVKTAQLQGRGKGRSQRSPTHSSKVKSTTTSGGVLNVSIASTGATSARGKQTNGSKSSRRK